ncbi:hypothetical protein [Chryseobacterium carnipullorum]|uniref:Uncharacterized protein n=1 Tax=Chryseobacterium carnipullorum TaxID=1124835 RepID=A0A376DTP0_CHRCU|nr:hypothetical protein [Chryseobacterium carnipullorum]STC95408.1 Uncharacterised protein [Chryseobacterium carnipullorum]
MNASETALELFIAHELYCVNYTVENALIYVERMIRDKENKDFWQEVKVELLKMKI